MAVQGATFNMRGQLYYGHANAMALSSSPVVSAQAGLAEQGIVPLRCAGSTFRLG